MEKIKMILKTIGTVIATLCISLVSFIFIRNKKNTKNEKEKAEKAREEKKNELEKKTADDIAADSPNVDAIRANIEREEEEYRKRIRNRLRKKLYGKRSTIPD